jgi:RES domain-containing protein
MPTVWRVVKRTRAATAFDGEGAQRFGGRWNSAGHRAVYASASKSLALLELLVHLDVTPAIPRLAAFAFELDAQLIEAVAAERLPRQWRTLRGRAATQQLGDDWLAAGHSLALAVPSAIVPEESNYLLNPAHPAFARLRFGRPMPFLIDARLTARPADTKGRP